jgi:hypothetical protein
MAVFWAVATWRFLETHPKFWSDDLKERHNLVRQCVDAVKI